MCLSIPYRIKKITGNKAVVTKQNNKLVEIDIKLTPDLRKGDWVLLLNNMAIEKVSSEEAKQIINLYNYDKNK